MSAPQASHGTGITSFSAHLGQDTPEARISRGIAPVKPEFLAKSEIKIQVEAVCGVQDKRTSVAAVEKKSRNQLKRERKQERESDRNLCWSFVQGKCSFADACKRSHNLEAYLSNKEAELPGRCPFEATGECKYGLMCRWMSKHQNGTRQNDDGSAQLQIKQANTHTSSNRDVDNTAESAGDGTLPCGTVELPVSHQVDDEFNTLHSDLLVQLRKETYPFTRSTAMLNKLGCRISRKKKSCNKEGKKQKADTDADVSAAQPAKIYDVSRDGTGFDKELPLRQAEKKRVDFREKLYLAPLTTVGNLPFRRICKGLGADVTCGEMAMAVSLLQGSKSEWALLKRHPCEDLFGVQICGGYPDAVSQAAELLEDNISMDFIDVNCGCPIDLVCNKGAGSSLLTRLDRLEAVVRAGSGAVSCPFTFKTRKGYHDNSDIAHTFVDKAAGWGAAAMTLHGRTRAQRYTKQADWDYVDRCSQLAAPTGLQLIGNGDIFSYEDYRAHMESASRDIDSSGGLATCMIARGALIKPWIFTEIKEQRTWDISASERFDVIKQFCNAGLEHWGSDTKGVEATRRFLLEWLSFLHRYVPVGLLERLPCKLHWRPPSFVGRSDLETLLASGSCSDWVRISEMLLGPAPPGFQFSPKHRSNAYATVDSTEAAMAFDDGQQNG